MPSYRPNVAAILIDEQGRILVAERVDVENAWQFPQGGVDKGETAEQALERELLEEVNLRPEYYRVEEKKSGYCYDFPQVKRSYRGQQQAYFLCRILEKHKKHLCVDTKKPEFRQIKWIEPQEFQLSWLPEFKKEVYTKVLRDFFEVTPVQ